MTITSLLPILEKYARTLTRQYPDEDYRDLVQDTIVKVLASGVDVTEGYIIIACKNTWRDKLAYRAVRKGIKYLEDMPVQPMGYLPQVEVDIYCTQAGINLHEYELYKHCNSCNKNKKESEFYKSSNSTYCKICHRQQVKNKPLKSITDPIKLAIKREQNRKRSQLWRNRNKAH